jgi:hypothetical protein
VTAPLSLVRGRAGLDVTRIIANHLGRDCPHFAYALCIMEYSRIFEVEKLLVSAMKAHRPGYVCYRQGAVLRRPTGINRIVPRSCRRSILGPSEASQ